MEPNSQKPAAPVSAQSSLPNIPAEWPDDATGKGLYKYSKQAIKRNTGKLLLLAIVSMIVSFSGQQPNRNNTVLIISLLGILLGILVSGANTVAVLDSVDGKKVSLQSAFARSAGVFVKLLIADTLAFVVIIIGFILLIIPGIILSARLSLINYYIVDQKLGPIAAIKSSYKATAGNVRKIFQIWSLNILIALLVFTIIGIPFALYFWFMFSAATAIAYRYLSAPTDLFTSPVQPVAPIPQPQQPLPPSPAV